MLKSSSPPFPCCSPRRFRPGGAARAVARGGQDDLAPTGELRAAINFGNSVLAQKAQDGSPAGISADLSHELAKRLNAPVEFVTFDAAGKAVRGGGARAPGHRLRRDRAGARARRSSSPRPM